MIKWMSIPTHAIKCEYECQSKYYQTSQYPWYHSFNVSCDVLHHSHQNKEVHLLYILCDCWFAHIHMYSDGFAHIHMYSDGNQSMSYHFNFCLASVYSLGFPGEIYWTILTMLISVGIHGNNLRQVGCPAWPLDQFGSQGLVLQKIQEPLTQDNHH